jgi:ubiquinone biosynthesis accessory factor UbiJ
VFTESGIELHRHTDAKSDTEIIGTPLQMLGVVIHKTKRQQFFAEDVKINGDAELGQSVVELFDQLEIDWQEQISHVIGDVPTQHISNFMQRMKGWLSSTEQSFTANVSDYVHEEKQWLPAREELQDFFNDIDALRMDTDRMEARIQHLIQTQREDKP